MRRLKQIIAGALCAAMMLTQSPVCVKAAEQPANVIETVQETNEIATKTDATVTDAAEPLLSYLALGKERVIAPETEQVVLGFGDGNTVVTKAELTYQNETTGVVYHVSEEMTAGNLALFELDFPTNAMKGEYVLQTVSYAIEEGAADQSYELDFADAGIEAHFGVESDVANDADAYVVENFEEEGIIVTDVDGNTLTSEQLANALGGNEATNSVKANGLDADGGALRDPVVVVLDPGHGGYDPGAIGNGVQEKTINLKIAQYCKAELDTYYGVKTYLTRTSDSQYLDLGERTAYAKSVGASIFISIHNNSSTSSASHGACVFYPNENYRPDLGKEGEALAAEILENLVALGLADGGIHTRLTEAPDEEENHYPDGSLTDYYGVIKSAKKYGFAGLIVEHAFVSNASDVHNYLSTDAQLKSLGVADAAAIAEFYSLSKTKDKKLTDYTYHGINYEHVFNPDFYFEKYPDIKRVFGDDEIEAFRHFIYYGMNEGRMGIEGFDVKSYKNANPDLRAAFGNDLAKYYQHYTICGYKEPRKISGVDEVIGRIHSLYGVDYSAVYDFDYYEEKNPDIKAVFGNDDIRVLQHFINNGMKEKRTANADFELASYMNQYVDLRNAYGINYPMYYVHYMKFGKNEGRIAKGVTERRGKVTAFNGQNYALVYDFDTYEEFNPDIKEAFGDNDVLAMFHFVNNGMSESRVANKTFDVTYYRSYYTDLRNVFGDNMVKYYLHYINYGYQEGRIAYRATYMPIMGETTTTVSQMAAYYRSRVGAYPEFYASEEAKSDNPANDAPTLEDFCRIYIEECNMEGVDASVAFCQSMKETGFLRYGGQVKQNQFNFAGLGALDGGAGGATFSSVREGIRAHVQHLKAYASDEDLVNPCVDGRFKYVTRGCSPYVEWLGINENPLGYGWATSVGYGYSIVDDYIKVMKRY